MKRILTLLPLLLLTLSTSGCDLIGDILEFGFWVAVILVLLIVLVIWWIARLVRGRRDGGTRTGRRGPPPSP